MHRKTPWWIDIPFLLALGFGVFQAATHRIELADWWYFRTYTPSAEVAKLADDAGMSAEGRRLFYRGDPQLVSKDELDGNCDAENLGCITEDGRIFILIPQEGEEGEAVVTAAHEMLHMAYRRIKGAESDSLRSLLETEVNRLNDSGLNRKLSETADEDEFFDEAHSILGTEHSSLLDDTEQHFSRYFSDRNKVLSK